MQIDFLEHILNSITEGISVTDMSDNIVYVNKSFCEMYGYEEAELIGNNISILRSDKNDPQIVKEILPQTIQKGWEGNIYNQRKNGDYFLINLKTSIVTDHKNKPIALLGIANDLTDEIQKSLILKDAENKYQKLFYNLRDAIFESTPEGKIIDINPSGIELFGCSSKEELLNTDIVKQFYFNPEDRARFKEILERKGFVKNYEIRIRNLKGKELFLLETAFIEYDEFNDKKFYRGILRDITEEKRAEIRYNEYIHELADANRQLHDSQEELQKLNASKDRLFSIIAHDLRSPFTSLMGLSQFLIDDLEDLTDEEIRTFSKKINESSKNIFSLLENLLQWSRIQTDRLEYEVEDLRLSELVSRAITLLQGNAKNKDIKIINHIEDSLIAKADKNVISSVIQNLLSNAIKFTNLNGIIQFSALEKSDSIAVTITDNGIGMTHKEQEKLFKHEVIHTTKGTNNELGTGLGLILCKELIEKSGGSITVNSEKNKGTSFTFTLPKSSK